MDMATQHVTDSGESVIGTHPAYINQAKAKGASYFDIGDKWDDLPDDTRTAMNTYFMDDRIAAGDTFTTANTRAELDDIYKNGYGRATRAEIDQLQSNGYTWRDDTTLQR